MCCIDQFNPPPLLDLAALAAPGHDQGAEGLWLTAVRRPLSSLLGRLPPETDAANKSTT